MLVFFFASQELLINLGLVNELLKDAPLSEMLDSGLFAFPDSMKTTPFVGCVDLLWV